MAGFEVLLSKGARKQLSSLPIAIHDKIIKTISELSTVARPLGCKKLKGYKTAWRIRIGDY